MAAPCTSSRDERPGSASTVSHGRSLRKTACADVSGAPRRAMMPVDSDARHRVSSSGHLGQVVVTEGEALVVVSAMKMEHVLGAGFGAVDILVREGDAVVVDEVVARVVAGQSPAGVEPLEATGAVFEDGDERGRVVT